MPVHIADASLLIPVGHGAGSPRYRRSKKGNPMNALEHRAVEAVYGAALHPPTWGAALQSIADCFDDIGALLVYSRDDGRWGTFASTSLEPLAAEYMRDWADRDTRAIRAQERGYFLTRDVITDRDVLSEAEMDRDPLYTELLPRYGLRYFAGANVAPQPGVQVALAVQRSAIRKPYTESELVEVGRLARHVETALRLSMAMAESDVLASGLSEALNNAGIGVLALDRLGRVTFANTMARQLIDAESMEAVRQEVMRLVRESGAEPGKGGGPSLINRSAHDRPLVLRLLPFKASRQDEPFNSAEMLSLIYDPAAGGNIDATLLRDLFEMTLGEARVAALIGAGQSVQQAAGRLGLKEQSVRTVLKRVFMKTQVSRQAELTMLLQRLRLTS